jgi:PhzF family phenazine biosynthesis protein
MNHSETAFVRRKNETLFEIRWFTPTAEEPFCGHGVLAAAKVLHDIYRLRSVKFRTFSEINISASIPTSQAPGDVLKVSMHFPSSPLVPHLAITGDVRLRFANALGIDEKKIVAIGQNELRDIVIELHSSVDFSAAMMEIDPKGLLDASPEGTRSQVITSRGRGGKEGVDFLKRVFAYGGEGNIISLGDRKIEG